MLANTTRQMSSYHISMAMGFAVGFVKG